MSTALSPLPPHAKQRGRGVFHKSGAEGVQRGDDPKIYQMFSSKVDNQLHILRSALPGMYIYQRKWLLATGGHTTGGHTTGGHTTGGHSGGHSTGGHGYTIETSRRRL